MYAICFSKIHLADGYITECLQFVSGKFSNLTSRTSPLDCQLCLGGEYCDQPGLEVPAGKCSAGYYCTIGANSSTPSQGANADICPKGYFCPVGSVTPLACPPGTYNSAVGRQRVTECTVCSGGRYCPYYNMTSPGPLCEPGRTFFLSTLLLVNGRFCPQVPVRLQRGGENSAFSLLRED